MIDAFDRKQVARQRLRALSASGPDAFFLYDWAVDQITDRLDVIRRTYKTCLRIGARGKRFDFEETGVADVFTTEIAAGSSRRADVVCAEDFLPFAPRAFDLIVSPLCLHTVNDLPGALLQIRQSLKPDGLFIAAMFGGETLHGLRQCLAEAELELSDGMSPRVAPFADKQQAGGLLQRAEFALPVVDSDIVTVTYENAFKLMHDLRAMGEANAVTQRSRVFASKDLFARAAQLYAERFADPDGRIRASFEIIFMLGWAPHDSQQQPLRRGSAETRLADVLGTREVPAGKIDE